MAPINPTKAITQWLNKRGPHGHGKVEMSQAELILEAWGQGLTVGAFVILLLIVVCNYRRGVTLHKLILMEMFLAMFHAFFIFFDDPAYGWYLSSSSLLLFISYQLHNIIAYLKIKAFLPQRWSRRLFIITLILVQPYWIIEAWDNFEYWNLSIEWNIYTRPWEPLARDPWWIFTTVFLFYKIKAGYDFTITTLFKSSPRFGVMTLCMILSIGFMLGDVIVTAESLTVAKGINPYWRLSLVFKCASDTIFLDDFKSVLDRIVQKRFERFSNAGLDNVGVGPSHCNEGAGGGSSNIRNLHSNPTSPTSQPKKFWQDTKSDEPIEIELERGRSIDNHSLDIATAASSEDTFVDQRNSSINERFGSRSSVRGTSLSGNGLDVHNNNIRHMHGESFRNNRHAQTLSGTTTASPTSNTPPSYPWPLRDSIEGIPRRSSDDNTHPLEYSRTVVEMENEGITNRPRPSSPPIDPLRDPTRRTNR